MCIVLGRTGLLKEVETLGKLISSPCLQEGKPSKHPTPRETASMVHTTGCVSISIIHPQGGDKAQRKLRSLNCLSAR